MYKVVIQVHPISSNFILILWRLTLIKKMEWKGSTRTKLDKTECDMAMLAISEGLKTPQKCESNMKHRTTMSPQDSAYVIMMQNNRLCKFNFLDAQIMSFVHLLNVISCIQCKCCKACSKLNLSQHLLSFCLCVIPLFLFLSFCHFVFLSVCFRSSLFILVHQRLSQVN